jgi:hypothetical protein
MDSAPSCDLVGMLNADRTSIPWARMPCPVNDNRRVVSEGPSMIVWISQSGDAGGYFDV